MNERIPIVETYRGVSIHAFQPADRIEGVVKPAIDLVFATSGLLELFNLAADRKSPPEARFFAAARCEAEFEMTADRHVKRVEVDIEILHANVAALSMRWTDPCYCTILYYRSREAIARDPESRAAIMEAKLR